MIVVFQSKASGDVIMFGDVAHRMMELMGKDASDQGIVTVAQLPAALAGLKAAVEADREEKKNLSDEDLPQFETAADGSRRPYVGLSQRATPLVELLERSLKKQVPVVWGV